MSTYDEAYQSSRGTVDKGAWNCICTCEDGELSEYCDKCNYTWDGKKKNQSVIDDLRKDRQLLKN